MYTDNSRRRFLRDASSAALTLAAASTLRPHLAWSQTPARIRVGQIGTAHAHASGKMETLRKFSDTYEVVGVVEPDPKRKESAMKQKAYAGVRWISEAELLNSEGLQCVVVETGISELVPAAQRCVDAGMHVHLDKPAGQSLTAFQELHAAATRSDRCIQLGYMFRYNPAFALAARAAHDGWLGTVFEASGVMSKKIGQAAREELKKYPGGTMFELGCHLIDALVWMLGPPEKTVPYVRHTLSDGLADNMLATFEYPKATATIRTSVNEPFGFRRRQFTLVGTEGVADIHPLEPPIIDLALEKPHGEFKSGVQTPQLTRSGGRYDGDFIDLAMVIRGEKQLAWDAKHDLAVHEAILRASDMPLDA
ncbi:MAG: Gfo/Idh/MocA family oxidoreductase [Pirellulaceae bacterium]|nr:Gfo/Idh/MocA family oxidoreductase [Pirellulaceae bacterium]